MKFLIYKHTSPSGKSYIGQTNDLSKRNWGHRNSSNCSVFSNAIKKYGWDAFTHEIIAENLTLSESNMLEEKLIKDLNTLVPNGYNLRTGGDSSLHSEESKTKNSRSNMGRIIKQETRDKISATTKGKIHSEETRRKLSESLKGRPHSVERKNAISVARNSMSEEKKIEHRAKISESLKGRKLPDEVKEKIRKSRENRTPEQEIEYRKRISAGVKASIERRRLAKLCS